MYKLKHNRKLLLLFGVILLLGTITVTVPSLQNQQDIRQRAASNDSIPTSGSNPEQSPTAVIQASETPVSPSDVSPTAKLDLYLAPNDTAPPRVALIDLNNGARVKANTQVKLSARANDDKGVGNLEFLINGTLICSSAAPYTCNWDVPAQPNGQYVITVRAYDLTGNVSTKSTVVSAN